MSRHDGSKWQLRTAGTGPDQTNATRTPSDSSGGVSCDMMSGRVVNATGRQTEHRAGFRRDLLASVSEWSGHMCDVGSQDTDRPRIRVWRTQ